MRRSWPLVAVPLAALALAAIVGVLRRDSLASTPGEVVERFLDRIVRDRVEKAAPLLASADTAVLKQWKEDVESGLGKVRRVRGETDWISGDDAEATGVLVAGKRERRLRFALEREGGRWRIARLDDFWGNGDAESSLRVREESRERRRPARLSSPIR